ncbi:MAG: PKD domain-containing protein, partial [Candidatus Peregrinibacteria bacterium]
MKKLILAFLVSVLIFPISTKATNLGETLKPVITANNAVRVSNNIIFDASASLVLDNRFAPTFSWNFGDGTFGRGDNVVHAYREPGQYTVKLTLAQGSESATIMQDVFAYQK